MDYIAPLFEENADIERAPVGSINSFHWEKEGYSRPVSFFRLCAEKGKGIFARLWSYESNIRAECKKRDDPVYTDSCLEFFIMPFADDKRYMNFEVNPNGIYLSQIGEKREDRKFIKEVSSLEPIITPFTVNDEAWGYDIFLSEEFISSVYGCEYTVEETTIKGNFYKCADLSVSPHYCAHFPVSSASLGFHNPDCFGNIKIIKVNYLCQ